MSLTIGLITCRKSPRLDWMFDSLRIQPGVEIVKQIIIVDYFAQACDAWTDLDVAARFDEVVKAAGSFADITFWCPPMPNVWGGPNRLTKEVWWHISAARNTIICFAKSPFVAMTDDRCSLSPGWLKCVQEAMTGNYAVNGSYEKVYNLVVESGRVKSYNEPGNGKDPRITRNTRRPIMTYGGCWFGCNMALPLEACLAVNGFDSWCDSVGLEDVVFGNMLARNGYPTMFDPRMKIVEDRTPSEVGEMPKRTDKGISPNDRSHALLDKIGGSKRATHPFDIRAMRDSVQAGNPFPPPWGPTHDFFDNEPLGEMYVR